MKISARLATTLLSLWAPGLGGGAAYAQTAASPAVPVGAWTAGGSAGLWDRVPTDSEHGRRNGHAVDLLLQRRVGAAADAGASSIRVDVGRGRGAESGQPGFDYRRVLVGVERPFVSASRAPFHVYTAFGGGAYLERSPGVRSTKPSVFGALGMDVSLGSSPLSITAEAQLHSIGASLFGTTSLGTRVHF